MLYMFLFTLNVAKMHISYGVFVIFNMHIAYILKGEKKKSFKIVAICEILLIEGTILGNNP